ncbi:hypothetical protein D9M73_121450 [compost metagenome]
MQRLLDLGDQLLVGERLADVTGNSGLDRLDNVLLVATAGDHHEGHCFEGVLLAAPGQQFQAGHFRHFPVAQDQVEGFLGQHGLGLSAIDRVFNPHAREIVAQALLDQVTNERRVVHDQHIDLTHPKPL